MSDGRLLYPKQVGDELKRRADPGKPDLQFKWAHDNATLATSRGPSFEQVRAVLAQVRQVLDADKDAGAEEADPYVLALANSIRENGSDARIVTEERKDLPAKMSVSTAAGLLVIPSLPLLGMLHAEGIVAF